ncbi:glycoside hydrolase family 127 protein [Eubacteriales bacterium OttesenSCG-928-A19]|nr:glycoside hydrolase family 127 protein [Eubacteriales bacterium OttesenSCG-928-A19]
MPASIVWNRVPLPPSRLAPLPPTAIQPGEALRARIAESRPWDIEGRLLRACLLRDNTAMEAAQRELAGVMHSDAPPSDAEIRAIMLYHAISSDKEAPLFLLRYARSLRDMLAEGKVLTAEQAANIGTLLHMCLWLYNLTGQRVLLSLCKQLKALAPDWMSTLHIFPQTRAVAEVPPMDTDAYWRVHGPTIAASLKTPALQALFEGGMKNETAFHVGWEKLTRYHGAAHGLFNADPLLAGADPSRNLEPTVVRETLSSLITLLWAQSGGEAGDLIERIYHGPLSFGGGEEAANQPTVRNASSTAGTETYCGSLWMASADEGLAAVGYATSEVRWRLSGQLVRVEMETAYPAEETIRLRVHVAEPLRFPLYLRIPAWAEGASAAVDGEDALDCKAGEFARLDREWQPGDGITLTLPMAVRTVARFHQSVSVERGPLTFALDAEQDAPWNRAIVPSRGFEVEIREGIPTIRAWMAETPSWTLRGDRPAAPPIAPAVRPEQLRQVTLWPYGRTSARIAQFPLGVLSEMED